MKKTNMLFAFLSLVIICFMLTDCGSNSSTSGFVIVTANLPVATVGTPYNQQLISNGGTGSISWGLTSTSSGLPGGLTINSTGDISGTPTVAGTFNITVQATDAASPPSTATLNLTITVLP